MKASELLKHQHDEVKALFKQLEAGKGNAKALLEKLANSLSAHMVIEQELFYPAVLEADKDLVLESYEEHAVARFALKRLLKTDPKNETFQARVTTLKELIHEKMGDGIMSAIDFEMYVDKVPDPKGDRVKVTMHGKFLGYRKW